MMLTEHLHGPCQRCRTDSRLYAVHQTIPGLARHEVVERVCERCFDEIKAGKREELKLDST